MALVFVKTSLTFQAKPGIILITVHQVSYNTPHTTALQWYRILFSTCHGLSIFLLNFHLWTVMEMYCLWSLGQREHSPGAPTPEKSLVLIEADHWRGARLLISLQRAWGFAVTQTEPSTHLLCSGSFCGGDAVKYITLDWSR